MQYPQRGDRLTHPAPATVGELAADLFDARRLGRSLGAAAVVRALHGRGGGLRIRPRIAESKGIEVSSLWVSASEAPSTVAAAPALPMAETEIIAEMVDLGGTDPQLLADDDFVELLLMAVRGRLRRLQPLRVRRGRPRSPPTSTPWAATRDHRISENMLRRWENPHQRRLHGVDVRRRPLLHQRPRRGRRRSWSMTSENRSADP